MGDLSKDVILAAQDTIIQQIHCPEWGGDVYAKSISGRDRDAWEFFLSGERKKAQEEKRYYNPKHFRASCLVMSLCNKEGTLLFTEKDVEALSGKSSKVLDRLFDVVSKINGLGQDVEEAAKN